MYVTGTVEFTESPDELWARLVKNDGASLRALATRMAQDGPFGQLLRFGWPPAANGSAITFDLDVGARTGRGGTVFVRWDGRHTMLEGEIEVVPVGPGTGRLRLTAAYEPPWSAALCDRDSLQRMAHDAAHAFLEAAAGGPRRLPTRAAAVPDPSTAARRILIEDEDPAWYRLMIELSDPDEYDFVSCRGPLLAPDGCPVLDGDSCPKVEWADTILHSLDVREAANRAVLTTLKRDWHEMPLPACEGSPATHWLDRRKSRAGGG
jgi:hypothetical protein